MAQIETEVQRRRVNPILIVVAVVAILGLLFFILLRSFIGGDDPETTAPPPGVVVAPVPSPSPTGPAEAPPETFEVFESKDPFRPLVSEAAPGAPAATAADGTGAPPADGGAPSSSGAGGAPAPSGGQRVSLLDILNEDGQMKAQVKVGSTVYTVAQGEVFADNYKLVSINGSCATLLHGDDKFTLCEGEEVIK